MENNEEFPGSQLTELNTESKEDEYPIGEQSNENLVTSEDEKILDYESSCPTSTQLLVETDPDPYTEAVKMQKEETV